MTKPNTIEDFWTRVKCLGPNECWLWTGESSTDSYGRFKMNMKYKSAHRFSYEEIIGQIPDELEIDHLCRNRTCVNPMHLEAVAHHENIKRGETGIYSRSKTHCPKDHEYTYTNTRIYGGRRWCRACNNERNRRRYANHG